MAKTIEELLEEATVPIGEQPYEVPENWVWTKLDDIVEFSQGIQVPIDKQATEYKEGLTRFIRIIDYTQETDDIRYVLCTNQKSLVNIDDVVMIRYGTPGVVGRGKIGAIANNMFKINPSCESLNKSYLFYFFQDLRVYDEIKSKSSSTTMPATNFKTVSEIKIPLPPLSEQQRIVTKIESLFSKIDKAKELIEEAREEFENRKAAILAKAFRGELTEKWREENQTIEPVTKCLNKISNKKIKSIGYDKVDRIPYKIPNTWEWLGFKDIGELERGRSKHRPRNDEKLFGGPYPFIQTGDVARSGIEIKTHSQTLSEFGLQQSRLFPKGTVCITIAANIGDTGILTYDCCFPDSVVGFTPNELTISRYVNYYLNVIKNDLEHYAPATAQKNINLQILKDILIPIAPLEEQKQMVEIIDELLYQESKIEELTQLEEQIELLKKSILAKAFRGDLGTNDSAEESAIELLKEILEEKIK